MYHRLTSGVAAIVLSVSGHTAIAADETASASSQRFRYRFELVYVAESRPSEWLFVISGTGYRTLEALKRGIAKLPKPAALEFYRRGRRSPDEPLSSEAEVAALINYAKSQDVEFIQVPSK
jgi:hypothetical protein